MAVLGRLSLMALSIKGGWQNKMYNLPTGAKEITIAPNEVPWGHIAGRHFLEPKLIDHFRDSDRMSPSVMRSETATNILGDGMSASEGIADAQVG